MAREYWLSVNWLLVNLLERPLQFVLQAAYIFLVQLSMMFMYLIKVPDFSGNVVV